MVTFNWTKLHENLKGNLVEDGKYYLKQWLCSWSLQNTKTPFEDDTSWLWLCWVYEQDDETVEHVFSDCSAFSQIRGSKFGMLADIIRWQGNPAYFTKVDLIITWGFCLHARMYCDLMQSDGTVWKCSENRWNLSYQHLIPNNKYIYCHTKGNRSIIEYIYTEVCLLINYSIWGV